METSFDVKKRHHGYNVKRLREILGVKQEDLAQRMELTQQTISKLENKDTLEDEVLTKIAKALSVPMEALKSFSEDSAANFINTFHDNSGFNYQCNFNPLDKVVQLYDEKVVLYERMLKAEQEKVALLEEVLKGKK